MAGTQKRFLFLSEFSNHKITQHDERREEKSWFVRREGRGLLNLPLAEIGQMTGTFGAFLLVFGLPLMVQFFWFLCDKYQCIEVDAIFHILQDRPALSQLFWELFPSPTSFQV